MLKSSEMNQFKTWVTGTYVGNKGTGVLTVFKSLTYKIFYSDKVLKSRFNLSYIKEFKTVFNDRCANATFKKMIANIYGELTLI